MTDRYIGTELEVLSATQNWKAYFSRALLGYGIAPRGRRIAQ